MNFFKTTLVAVCLSGIAFATCNVPASFGQQVAEQTAQVADQRVAAILMDVESLAQTKARIEKAIHN
jgi:hypothetical protein